MRCADNFQVWLSPYLFFFWRDRAMEFNLRFILNSILFGIGLAMDAFSVSLANGLNEPKITLSSVGRIAGTFGVFQTAMPLLGWLILRIIENNCH